MTRLRINGREVELSGPTPLRDYLAGLGVDQRGVAVEINERILERTEIAATILEEGDVVEIVRMVGGGRSRERPPRAAGGLGSPPPPPPARPTARDRRR